MADNITLDTGSGGSVLATEDEGGVHYQKVKLTASGTGTTEELSKAEDTAHSTGEHGIMGLAVRRDADTTLVGADGDYAPIQVDANGRIKVECFDGGDSHTVDNAGTFAVQIVDTSFAVADGNALGEGVLVQGDDGTDRKNINVDASTGDVQVDVTNTVTVAAHAVTNAGTFPVQIVDTSFAVGDGNALGEGVLVQGDDGTDRKNINVDATTGDVQVDVTNTVTVAPHAVTNAGTFATQATLQAADGTDIGDVDVASIAAGANLIGDVGIGVRTSGGTSIFRSIDLDEGALEVIKGSAGQIYWIHVMNLATAVRYVKIYNATSGTYGTGTPVLTFPIPTQGDSNGAGFTLTIPNGIAFGTGISIGAGTGVADNDTGAPGTNDVIVNIGFA